MDNTQKPAKNKPLNCLYCLQAILEPGSSRTADHESIPPQPHCFCYDVPHELADLFNLKMKMPGTFYENIFTWLPYHCGHFQPRLIRMHCFICGAPGTFSEWQVADKIYTGEQDIMACSGPCIKAVQELNNL